MILHLTAPARDYPAIRDAAWKLLQAGHVSEVLKASYAHLIVNGRLQDCSVPQHYIVYLLPLILSDLRAGRSDAGDLRFPWQCAGRLEQSGVRAFPYRRGTDNALAMAQRWRGTAGTVVARRLAGISRRDSPLICAVAHQRTCTWMQAVPPNEHAQRLTAARTAPSTADGRVLIIADSRNRAARQNFASQTPGASTVEAVDLQDLIAFAD